MNNKQRDWARQYNWFYCSDSKAIWVKDSDGQVLKFTSMRALKSWTTL